MRDSSNCKNCGKSLKAGEVCINCTLTDIDNIDFKVMRAADMQQEYSAFLIETKSAIKHPLIGTKWKIGRDTTNQLVIADDAYASKFHAWITLEDGRYYIEDLGSTNGTLVNNEPLTRRRPLGNGDHFRCGRSDFTFVREPLIAVNKEKTTRDSKGK